MTTDASSKPAAPVLEEAAAMKWGLVAILYFAVRASFTYECSSDGCTPPIVVAVAAAVALAVQLFILIPLDARKQQALDKRWGLRAAIWTVASIAAFGVPMLVWWLGRP